MPLFPKTSANLLLKEKNNSNANDTNTHTNDINNNSLHSDDIRGLVLLSSEALEDDLELEKDLEDLPI